MCRAANWPHASKASTAGRVSSVAKKWNTWGIFGYISNLTEPFPDVRSIFAASLAIDGAKLSTSPACSNSGGSPETSPSAGDRKWWSLGMSPEYIRMTAGGCIGMKSYGDASSSVYSMIRRRKCWVSHDTSTCWLPLQRVILRIHKFKWSTQLGADFPFGGSPTPSRKSLHLVPS